MICGSCKGTEGITVEHVKSCYGAKQSTGPVASDYKPMALAQPINVPPSKYCLDIDGELLFFDVTAGTKNPKVRFVKALVGHPGDWLRLKVSRERADQILHLIRYDSYTDVFEGSPQDLEGPQAAAVRFSRKFTCCACCGSPLTVPLSRARGLGPDCYKRFAA